MTTEDRFWSKVEKSAGCWLWTAGLCHGYGQFSFLGLDVRAHRFAYELLVGPIPAGLEIDHLCRDRACVNPDHLEPVTHRENGLRGESPAVRIHRSGRCGRGHLRGDERCKQCSRAYTQAYRAIRTAHAAASREKINAHQRAYNAARRATRLTGLSSGPDTLTLRLAD